VGKHKQYRDAAEFDGDGGYATAGGLGEVDVSRRSFLGRIGGWSAAFAVFGLGPEAWMRVAYGRSIIPSALAAGATRDRQLHPFPSDDPYNMPLGTNAWYAPTSDPATSDITSGGGSVKSNSGWSHPIYFPTPGVDPVHRFMMMNPPISATDKFGVRSYKAEEHRGGTLYEILQTAALPAMPAPGTWADRHLHIINGNDVVEFIGFRRLDRDCSELGDSCKVDWYSGEPYAMSGKIVRNRLDHYHFGNMGRSVSNPLANVAGTRAHGGVAIAGLIRKHEIERPDPHIPHAIAIDLQQVTQNAGAGQGNPSSPLYNEQFMFPAVVADWPGKYPAVRDVDPYGNCRMGMRFALDPTICTDAWIMANAPKLSSPIPEYGLPAGIPNPWQVAIAKALRDYGCINADTSDAKTTLAAEQGINAIVHANVTLQTWSWCRNHLRRVAGRMGGNIIHNPLESHWDIWRNNKEGWGGGPPRVPYSPPLAPLSGDVPPARPEAPPAIQVTGKRTFDGTG
jgi:hypothetical protein